MKKKSAWWSVNYLFSLKSKMNLQKYRPLSKGLIFLNPSVRLGSQKQHVITPLKHQAFNLYGIYLNLYKSMI